MLQIFRSWKMLEIWHNVLRSIRQYYKNNAWELELFFFFTSVEGNHRSVRFKMKDTRASSACWQMLVEGVSMKVIWMVWSTKSMACDPVTQRTNLPMWFWVNLAGNQFKPPLTIPIYLALKCLCFVPIKTLSKVSVSRQFLHPELSLELHLGLLGVKFKLQQWPATSFAIGGRSTFCFTSPPS